MKIEKIHISKLNPAEYNPRKDLQPGDAEYEKLKRSMEQFGYVEPVVWNKTTGRVIGGHQRLKVLVDLGLKEVDCVVIELSEEKEKALNVALNKISGEWNTDKLAMLISDLQGSDFDVSLTGFEEDELADLFSKTAGKEVTDDDFDLTAALEKASFVERGDIWIVGRHRLMCADATSAEDVAALMDRKRANLVVTDPPYNCSYEGGTGMKIINDSWDNSKKFYQFLLDAFKNAYDSLSDGSAFYCFHSDAEKVNFFNATVDAGFHYSTTCIWVKNALVIGRMDYQMRHEPIVYAFKNTAKHKFYGDRKQTTVWEFDKPAKSQLHPTTKPLSLVAYPIKMSSQENGIVLDLFGGSGSTLIACEQMNRVCHTMELDEKYASVILRRAVENGISPNDIYVFRDNVRIPYAELVKEIDLKA
ncbi:MAG: site-specific DNA-methyltransferase [Acutalibacteraceae bacterium]|jgi:DNA modification methylase|nr:MAG TPA: adenine specific DNA methyltransferase [Caudoviricetes sp.]